MSDEKYDEMVLDIQKRYLELLIDLMKKYDGIQVASTIQVLLAKMIFDCVQPKEQALDVLCTSIKLGVEAHIEDNFKDKVEAMKELNKIMDDYAMPKPSSIPIDLRKFAKDDT